MAAFARQVRYWRTLTGLIASSGAGGSLKNSFSFTSSRRLSSWVRAAFVMPTSVTYRSATQENRITAAAGGEASRSISAQRLMAR